MQPYIPEIGRCCPGHDTFSKECYANNRSKRAQTRDTKLGHRIVRRVAKNELRNEIRCDSI
jgi:hypothetical protein